MEYHPLKMGTKPPMVKIIGYHQNHQIILTVNFHTKGSRNAAKCCNACSLRCTCIAPHVPHERIPHLVLEAHPDGTKHHGETQTQRHEEQERKPPWPTGSCGVLSRYHVTTIYHLSRKASVKFERCLSLLVHIPFSNSFQMFFQCICPSVSLSRLGARANSWHH